MGPLLGAASWGLRYFIDLGAPTVGAELGAISNVLAGALLTAIRHPRFGRLAGGSGILIGVALLVLNLATFPDPPADAGLADLGPLLGLWYLAVSVRLLGSWNWAVTRAREQAAATPAA